MGATYIGIYYYSSSFISTSSGALLSLNYENVFCFNKYETMMMMILMAVLFLYPSGRLLLPLHLSRTHPWSECSMTLLLLLLLLHAVRNPTRHGFSVLCLPFLERDIMDRHRRGTDIESGRW